MVLESRYKAVLLYIRMRSKECSGKEGVGELGTVWVEICLIADPTSLEMVAIGIGVMDIHGSLWNSNSRLGLSRDT